MGARLFRVGQASDGARQMGGLVADFAAAEAEAEAEARARLWMCSLEFERRQPACTCPSGRILGPTF